MANLGKGMKLPHRLNDPPAQEFDRIRTELMQIDNVVGCFIGPRRKGGRLLRSIGVVAIVDQKLAPDNIPPNQMIDKHIRWSHRNGGAIRKISSDVQELSPYSAVLAFGSPILGPGDDVRTSDATIGVAAMHPQYGEVITTAGHAVYEGPPGAWEWAAGEYPIQVVPAGSSESIVAEVRRVVCNEWCDYAILKPQSPLSCLNLYRDRNPIWPPYHLNSSDMFRKVWVSARDGFRTETKIVGLNATIPFGHAGVMHGLILTDLVTLPGDSGSVLIDEHWRALGLLVGAAAMDGRRYSVFMPATIPIQGENAKWL